MKYMWLAMEATSARPREATEAFTDDEVRCAVHYKVQIDVRCDICREFSDIRWGGVWNPANAIQDDLIAALAS